MYARAHTCVLLPLRSEEAESCTFPIHKELFALSCLLTKYSHVRTQKELLHDKLMDNLYENKLLTRVFKINLSI